MSEPQTAEQINSAQTGFTYTFDHESLGKVVDELAELKEQNKALRDYAKELVHVLRTLKANAYEQARLACLLHGDSIDRALDRAKKLGI